MSTLPYRLDAVKRKAEFRLILPENISPPDSVREWVDEPVFEQASTTGLLKTRFLEKVDLFICMSEREVSSLAFPTVDGRLDYLCFKATEERGRRWSENLYLSYWNRAKSEIPQHLVN